MRQHLQPGLLGVIDLPQCATKIGAFNWESEA
jgi:hypothetical protein